MQFVVIEGEIYSLTKDPLSRGIIGVAGLIPLLSLALVAGHYVDRLERRDLLMKCVVGFLLISAGLFIVTLQTAERAAPGLRDCGPDICPGVLRGGIVRAFLGPTVVSLFGQLIPRVHYPNAATMEQQCVDDGVGAWARDSWPGHRMAVRALVPADRRGLRRDRGLFPPSHRA